MVSNAKVYTLSQAIEKAKQFCAYQERSHKETRLKLVEWGVRGDEVEYALAELIEQNFLSESRFANAFARGKFKIKKWGKLRIVRELEIREVSTYCINEAIEEEIDDEEYHLCLSEVIIKKWNTLGRQADYSSLNKLARYVISKGFEPNLVWDKINDIKNG